MIPLLFIKNSITSMVLTICYIIVDNVVQNFAICYCWRCPGQLYFSIRTNTGNNIFWLLWNLRFRCSWPRCCIDSCCRLWCCCWCRCCRGNTVSCITDEHKLQITNGQIIINLQDTDKSGCFAITMFNNNYCFIIQSPSYLSYLNQSLTAEESHLPFFIQ